MQIGVACVAVLFGRVQLGFLPGQRGLAFLQLVPEPVLVLLSSGLGAFCLPELLCAAVEVVSALVQVCVACAQFLFGRAQFGFALGHR